MGRLTLILKCLRGGRKHCAAAVAIQFDLRQSIFKNLLSKICGIQPLKNSR